MRRTRTDATRHLLPVLLVVCSACGRIGFRQVEGPEPSDADMREGRRDGGVGVSFSDGGGMRDAGDETPPACELALHAENDARYVLDTCDGFEGLEGCGDSATPKLYFSFGDSESTVPYLEVSAGFSLGIVGASCGGEVCCCARTQQFLRATGGPSVFSIEKDDGSCGEVTLTLGAP